MVTIHTNNANPNSGKVSYDGKTYQTVAYRLNAFRQQFPPDSHWDIETQSLHCDDDHVIFKATIKAPDGQTVATGHAFERWNASPLNQTSAYENAETSAIGRALAAAGFIGSEFATADELTLALQAQAQSRQASQAAAPAQSGQASAKPQPKPTATPAKPQSSQGALPAQATPLQPTPAQPEAKATSQAAKPAQAQAKPSGQAGPAEQSETATKPDEQLAEKWTREHLAQWLDQPCQFAKAQSRTWRELAGNQGEKIEVKGRPCQPRAYLHALESWANCGVWQRMKARVALELGKNGTQQADAAR